MGKKQSLKERIIEVSELFEEKGYEATNDERHHRESAGGESALLLLL